MKAKKITVNKSVMKMVVAAGFALCASLALSSPLQAQGAGSRRVFRPMLSRSATGATGSVLPGQTANNLNGATAGMAGMGAGANRSGGNSQTPLVMGTIVAGDASTGRILIQSQSSQSQSSQFQSNGNSQILQVSNATRFVTETAIAANDLQAGEWVQVQGVVTNAGTGTNIVTADTITAGQIPAFLQQNNRAIRVGGTVPGPTSGNAASNASGRPSAAPPNAATQGSAPTTLMGQITSVSPLVVTLNSGATVTIKATADAQVNRVAPLLFRNLQVGDRLMATGMTTSNGSFVLMDVAINM